RARHADSYQHSFDPDRIDPRLPSGPSAEEAAADREAATTKPGAPSAPKSFPTPEKAYKNQDFLNSPHARSIRIQCELTEPQVRFRKHGVNNTIVIYGSARIP